MKKEDRESYTVYINPKWRNPVVTTVYNILNFNHAKYSDALIVLTVMRGRVFLMRNRCEASKGTMPRDVDVSEQQLTILKLRAIPPGLIDYLNNPLPQENAV